MGGTHDARQRIIDATTKLVSEGGIRAATPAAVTRRAGTAKMSLYRHFDGKDELLEAALRESDAGIQRRVLGRGWDEIDDPRERLLSIFAGAIRRAERPGYSGCPYVLSGLETGDGHPLSHLGAEHKDAVIAALTAATRQLGAADPGQLAATLLMLLDGAIAHAVIRGSAEPLHRAAGAAGTLVDAAAPPR